MKQGERQRTAWTPPRFLACVVPVDAAMPEPKDSDWREAKGVNNVLADEALRLSKDMKAARREELAIAEAGDASKQTIFFRLPSDEGARVPAMRSIVAARIYDQMLLGSKKPSDITLEAETEAEASARQTASEASDGDIVVEGVSKEILQLVVDFIYSADFDVTDETVHQVLCAASQLKLHGAITVCTVFLTQPSRCHADSVGKILESAHQSGASKLKEHCLKYIDEHTTAVLSNPSFHPPPALFREVLSRDGLVIDELELFRYVMDWAKREQSKRILQAEAAKPPEEEGGDAKVVEPGRTSLTACLCDGGVIEQVRFALVSPEQLRDTVQPMLLRAKDDGSKESTADGAVPSGGGASKYVIPEQLLLEAYQHHALMAIGQPSQVSDQRTRERGLKRKERREVDGGASTRADAAWKERVQQARQRARRTEAWLATLPPGVERVSMSGMGLAADDVVLVSEWVRGKGKNVVELDLKANHIHFESLRVMLEGLKSCSRLRGLALGQNPLGRGGAEGARLGRMLGDAIRAGGALSRLEKLGLGGTELSEDDARELAAALGSKDHAVQVLGLSGNFIGREGAKVLLQSQKGKVGPLHTLVLTQNRIDAADFPELRSLAHPGLSLKL